jgi:hypothetical protein
MFFGFSRQGAASSVAVDQVNGRRIGQSFLIAADRVNRSSHHCA